MTFVWLAVFAIALGLAAAINQFAPDPAPRRIQAARFTLVLVLIWSAFSIAGGLVGLALLLGAVAVAEIIRFARRRGRFA